jgi:hypothetical protein
MEGDPMRLRRSSIDSARKFRALLGIVVATAAAAQQPAFLSDEDMVPSGRRPYGFADLDQDGAADMIGDVLFRSSFGRYVPFPGSPAFPPPTGGITSAMSFVFADLSGDGIVDALRFGIFQYFVGVPGGGFVPATLTPPVGTTVVTLSSVVFAAGDVDGDGDVDLVSTSGGPAVWLNSGGGVFVDATAGSGVGVAFPASEAPVNGLQDLDGDGALDLIFKSSTSTASVQRSVGPGVFAPPVPLPTPSPTFWLSHLPHAGDVDGDGLMDFVYTGTILSPPGTPNAPLVCLVRQTAPFVFSLTTTIPVTGLALLHYWAPAATLADLDANGDAEIVVGSAHGVEIYDFVAGALTPPSAPIPVLAAAFDRFDADGDGDVDVAAFTAEAGSVGGVRILYNDGTGVPDFVHSTSSPRPDKKTDAFPIDLDADGDVDLIAFGGPPSEGRVHVGTNDGNGVFHWSTRPCVGCPGSSGGSIAAGDFDGDGDVDLYVTGIYSGSDQTAEYFLADVGAAGFTVVLSALTPQVFRTRAADVDNDGDLDLVQTRQDYPAVLQARFNTNGVFSPPVAIPTAAPGVAAFPGAEFVLRDLDGDGDLDVFTNVLPAPGGAPVVVVNGGGGATTIVTPAGVPPASIGAPSQKSVAAADFDLDGDLDLVWGATLFEQVAPTTFVFRTTLPAATGSTEHVHVADWNADGLPDLIDWRSPPVVRLNTGNWTFVAGPKPYSLVPNGAASIATIETLTASIGRAATYVDVDADGDPDMIGGDGTVYVNRTRRLARGFPLRSGAPASFEISGPSNGTALLAGAIAGAARQTTPYGSLALDLATTVVLAGPLPLDANGDATVSGFLTPAAAAALAGTTFTFQAVVDDGVTGPKLTNARNGSVYFY